MNDSLESYNQTMLQRYSDSLEAQLSQMSSLAYELNDNPLIQQLNRADTLSNTDRLDIYRMLNSVTSRLFVSYPQVTDYYLYFSGCNLVLTSTGTFDPETFYSAYFRNKNDVSYEEWLTGLRTPNFFNQYITSPNALFSCQMSEKNIAYAKSIYINKSQNCSTTLVILVSKEYLRSNCIDAKRLSEGEISLFSNNGDLLLSTSAKPLNLRYDAENDRFDLSEDGYLTSYSMEQLGATLVYTLQKDDFTASLWNSYSKLRTVLTVVIVISILLAVLFTYLFYKPLAEIIRYLHDQQRIPMPSGQNDYQYIRTSIEHIATQQQESNLQLALTRQRIAQNELERMIDSDDWEEGELTVQDMLKKYGVSLPHPYIVALACRTPNKIFAQTPVWHDFCQHILTLHPDCVGICLHREDTQPLILINLPFEVVNDEDYDRFSDLMRQWISTRGINSLKLAFGSSYDVAHLRDAFRSAKQAMEYTFLYPDAPILDSRIVSGRCFQYFYPAKIEEQLNHAVCRRDVDAAQAVLDHVFDENLVQRRLSVQAAYQLLYALLNTAYQLEGILRAEEQTAPLSSFSSMNLSDSNILESRTQINFIFLSLCATPEEQPQNETPWRVNQIAAYIQAHYLDPSLSLDSVAEHFHLTPQYLSALFKKTLQVNFSTHIQMLRLSHAKELMKDPSLTLNAIAMQSGFNNYLALARVFQKFDNQSPGAYREQYFNKQS